MPERRELLLPGGQHTLYSDEVWYLITGADSNEVVLECRFQSDAPSRTGFPTWISTELTISRDEYEAVGRLHYGNPADLLAARRPSFVPEIVWARATEECRKPKSPPAS